MYMLIILEIIDIFFLFVEKHGNEAHYKVEYSRGTYTLDTTGTYTLDGCNESLFYLQLSHILNFQTLLLMDSTSSATLLRNIFIDLQLPEMHSGRRQSWKASGSRKNKRKLDFWCVSLGQICIFMYNLELEYRDAVQDIGTFVCICTSKMFLIHVHWHAIDGPSILYYKFHDIKNISYQGSWDLHGSFF